MTDIFFSYSSKDRERVRPIRDALAAQGFDIFWDQQVPAGVDWDTWIRQHLQRARCAVVFWSENSVASDNVRHEATVAKTQGKLVPVLIENLRADQFPMGLYSVQGANLAAWTPGSAGAEWQKLQAEVEAKLTPLWVTAKLHTAEAATLAEKARREAAESRIRALQEQLAKEAQAQRAAELSREAALAEMGILKARFATLEAELAAARSIEKQPDKPDRGTNVKTPKMRLFAAPNSAAPVQPSSSTAEPDVRRRSLAEHAGRLAMPVTLTVAGLVLLGYFTRRGPFTGSSSTTVLAILLVGPLLALFGLIQLDHFQRWPKVLRALVGLAYAFCLFAAGVVAIVGTVFGVK